jgi:hypothetical protein
VLRAVSPALACPGLEELFSCTHGTLAVMTRRALPTRGLELGSCRSRGVLCPLEILGGEADSKRVNEVEWNECWTCRERLLIGLDGGEWGFGIVT